jgi:hypothetical protein
MLPGSAIRTSKPPAFQAHHTTKAQLNQAMTHFYRHVFPGSPPWRQQPAPQKGRGGLWRERGQSPEPNALHCREVPAAAIPFLQENLETSVTSRAPWKTCRGKINPGLHQAGG